jgi:hypothetical protein
MPGRPGANGGHCRPGNGEPGLCPHPAAQVPELNCLRLDVSVSDMQAKVGTLGGARVKSLGARHDSIPMLKMMGAAPGAAGDRHDHRASAGHRPLGAC